MTKHLLRVGDLTKYEILAILDRAEELRLGSKPKQFPQTLLGLLFFQPSTRTRFGFHAAIARMGGTAITLLETKMQPSMTRPETPEDTFRSLASYCDIFVIRHYNVGFPDKVADFAVTPILNAGNGTDEHPTQTLIDLFAIHHLCGPLENLRIAVLGDLASSRAAHSFIRAIQLFPPRHLLLLSPPQARLPDEYRPQSFPIAESVEPRLPREDLDLLYVAGLPEQGEESTLDKRTRLSFSLHPAQLDSLSPNCKIFSPLPRIDEIHPAFDYDHNAVYFRQSDLAQAVRQSILEFYLS